MHYVYERPPCRTCGAVLYDADNPGLCCGGDGSLLPARFVHEREDGSLEVLSPFGDVPPELDKLFQSKYFPQASRKINDLLAFAAIGTSPRHGIHICGKHATVRVQSKVYRLVFFGSSPQTGTNFWMSDQREDDTIELLTNRLQDCRAVSCTRSYVLMLL